MKKKEFSMEELAGINDDICKWNEECKTTAAFKSLSDEEKDNFGTVTHIFAEIMYRFYQEFPGKWTAGSLEDAMTQLIPQAPMHELFYIIAEPILTVFFGYLHNIGIIKNRDTLCKRLKTSAVKMRRDAEKLHNSAAEPPLTARPVQMPKNTNISDKISKAETHSFNMYSGQSGEFPTDAPPKQDSPTLSQWEQLYKLAKNIRLLEPWDHMWDTDIITIGIPGQDEPVFCSTMGRIGECFGICVYPGYESYNSFRRILESEQEEGQSNLLTLFEQNCIICYFGDREELLLRDRNVLKELNLRFRGRNEWIYFRSMESGYTPWFINSEQADLLTQVFEQYIAAFESMIDNSITVSFDQGQTLIRSYSQEKGIWISKAQKMPPIPVITATLIVDNDIVLTRLKKQKRSREHLEFELTYIPTPVHEHDDDRPYFPTMLLIVEKNSGMIAEQQFVDKNSRPEVAILDMLTNYIDKNGRPDTISVRNDRIGRYIRDFCKKVGITLNEDKGVPNIDIVLSGLIEHLMNR